MDFFAGAATGEDALAPCCKLFSADC